MLAAALAGLQHGPATYSTVNVAGLDVTNRSIVTDPSCGKTTILGVTYTNYCVTEQCTSTSVGCSGTNTCYVKHCPGELSIQCHAYNGEYGPQCWSCVCP